MLGAFWLACSSTLLFSEFRFLTSAEFDHPSWVHGGGCKPFFEAGGELTWDELVEIRALPEGAEVFVCYDGRYGVDVKPDHPVVVDALGGGVILVENFLTETEIQHMRRKALEWTAGAPDEDGRQLAYGVGLQFKGNFDLPDARALNQATHEAFDDEILNSVESRIARFLQIPSSIFENYLELVVEAGNRAVGSVQHDKHHALVRRATALLHLSGGVGLHEAAGENALLGGEILFPALVRTELKQRGPRQERYSKRLKGIVSRTMRDLGSEDAWPELKVVSGDPLHRELIGLCDNASSPSAFNGRNGDGPWLAIAPLPGRAIFWWHERPFLNDTDTANMSGQILPDMWHVDCPVRSGKKVALHKFKNFAPEQEECSRLRWCHEAWRRLQGTSRRTEL